MSTDREYLKYQQAGALATTGASDAKTEVGKAHSRIRTFNLGSAANAATNTSETALGTVRFKSRLKSCYLTNGTNVAANASNYAVVSIYKRTSAGASQTLLGSWNTHASAQGALTALVPASLTLVSNADVVIDAGSLLTYGVGKVGTGQAIDQFSPLDFELEEV